LRYIDEPSEFSRRRIILSEDEIAGVHAILHELIEVGVGMIGDINAMGGDLAVDSGGLSVDDPIPHKQNTPPSPVPGRVESTDFESSGDRADTVNV